MSNPAMRKIQLPVLTADGEELSPTDAALFRSISDKEGVMGNLTDAEELATGRLRGGLDCQATLLKMVSRARDPASGMDIAEIEEIRPLYSKIKESKGKGYCFLEESEHQLACEKVKGKFIAEYNFAFDCFIRMVLEAELVPLVEVTPASAG